jgi:putative peptide zinc metalloprotease protein
MHWCLAHRSTSLLSSSWYRVADRKAKLRLHARLYRHIYRGEVWYLLQDPASTRVHRFTPAARLVISLMDGTRTVAQLWEIANKRLGEDAPTQDELIQLLGQLHSINMLQSDVMPDVAEPFSRGEREDKARHRRSFANPMALIFPLWDPDVFRVVFSAPSASYGALGRHDLACCRIAAYSSSTHWPELSNDLPIASRLDNLGVLYCV